MTSSLLSLRVAAPDEPSLELVPVAAGQPPAPYPEAYRARLTVDTLHDGDAIPARIAAAPRVAELLRSDAMRAAHGRARDWGADLVAGHLAADLGLPGFHRVNVARVVLDFNRFPGETPPEAGPLDWRALSRPLIGALGHEDKRYLLETHYDAISASMDAAIRRCLIKVAVHTYDERNASDTTRPEVSLLTRSASYQRLSRLPYGLFDPLFPDVLAESCAVPVLRDRIALTLEKAGVAVEHNYPYHLPDGSVEIRSQPWLFFEHLRGAYEQAHPETATDPGHQRIWEMLQNTNQRDMEGDALAGYLHRFRRPHGGLEAAFAQARGAYTRLTDFVAARPEVVERYRRSPERTSTITIEVRKDLVWRFDGDTPLGPRDDNARAIARLIARAIATYLREDRRDPEPRLARG